MAMMNKRNMMMAAAVVVVLVILYMFLGKSDNATAPFLTSGRSHIVPFGMMKADLGRTLVKEAGWENFRGGFDKARKEHGEGVYVAHVTPCSRHNWGRPGGEVCQKYFKGKAPIHISQRVCSRSGFGGSASYVCLEKPKPLPPPVPMKPPVSENVKAIVSRGRAVPPPRVPRADIRPAVSKAMFDKAMMISNKKLHDVHVRELELAHKLHDKEKMYELSVDHSKKLFGVVLKQGKEISDLKHELDKANNEIEELHDDVEDLENNCR